MNTGDVKYNPTLADRSRGYFIFIRPPRLYFCFFCSVVVAFSFYCPVRAALTFVGCDKSKQKRAFVPVSFYERVRSGGEIFRICRGFDFEIHHLIKPL